MLFTKNFERIEQLAAKEIELDGRGGAKAAELAQAERAAGESYLTGDGAVGVDAVLRLRAEAEAIGRAIGTVRNIRAEVIAAKFRSQAQDARTAQTLAHDRVGLRNPTCGVPHAAGCAAGARRGG